MDAEQEIARHRETVEELRQQIVGKVVASVEQEPNRGHFDSGRWCDDEPLVIKFTDGSSLIVAASGWHDSGGLGWEVTDS